MCILIKTRIFPTGQFPNSLFFFWQLIEPFLSDIYCSVFNLWVATLGVKSFTPGIAGKERQVFVGPTTFLHTKGRKRLKSADLLYVSLFVLETLLCMDLITRSFTRLLWTRNLKQSESIDNWVIKKFQPINKYEILTIIF